MKPEPREEALPPELSELLERRAARVRERPPQGEEESVFLVAEFPVGEEMWAIPLHTLRAAVALRSVTPVPLSPPHVIGILRFQGQIVTAISLSALLGGRGWREDPAVLLVVDVGGGQLVAVDCERIPKPNGIPHALVSEARARSTGPVTEITLPDLKQLFLVDLRRLILEKAPAPDAGAHGA
jgi:purine-binding chemotaxis protein CheW